MTQQPRVITCQGGSTASRLAAEVARELGALGLADPVEGDLDVEIVAGADRETIAIDGCRSSCSSRLAAARGVPVVAAVNLAELGAGEDVETADRRLLAERIAPLLGGGSEPVQPARPHRPGQARSQASGQVHTIEDYLLALDALTSPVVECGALITDAPTLASHVSEALGVSRAAAGEMLAKMEASSLVSRGGRKELLLTPAGRAAADTSVRHQRLLEVFATQILGYELAESYERARMLRAAFDVDAIDRLERSLGFPERCPHGWPVDPVQAREESHVLRTLASLAAGDGAQVACLGEDDGAALRRLVGLGITPGVDVTVTAASSSTHRLEADGRRVTLDDRTRKAIFVRA